MPMTKKQREAAQAIRMDLRAANTQIGNAEHALQRIRVRGATTYKDAHASRMRAKILKVRKEVRELKNLHQKTMNKTKNALKSVKPVGRPPKQTLV